MTEHKSRKESVRAFKRRHILEAARGLYEEEGPEGLTMRDIARAAGYSLGALYLHFRTKEEIEAGLLSLLLADLTRRLRPTAGSDPDELARDGFRLFFRHFSQNDGDRRLYLSGFLRAGEAEPERRLHAALGALANRLHQSGLFSASAAQGETLEAIAVINGCLLLIGEGRLRRMGADAEEIVDRHLERMLLRGKEQE